MFNRLGRYAHPDLYHGHEIDIYYDGMNRRTIGSPTGEFATGYVDPLLRRQLAGYAWAKCFLEDENFFRDFHCELYAQSLADASTPLSEYKLQAIASNAVPVVEGLPFLKWYYRQGALNTVPSTGYFLFQRINEFTIDYCFRDSYGAELMQTNAWVEWTVQGCGGDLLDSGADSTAPLGYILAIPYRVPETYSGRIKMTARASSAGGPISDVAYRCIGGESGVFGVVVGKDTGTVTLTPLQSPGSSVTVPVRNGAFSAPGMRPSRGRFLAVFRNPDGTTFSQRFNKDASSYYLELRPPWLSAPGSAEGEALTFALIGEPDRNYDVQATTNLADWARARIVRAGPDGVAFTVTNEFGPAPWFYRAALHTNSDRIFLPAASGRIDPPFQVHGDSISQTVETGVTTGGRAVYTIEIGYPGTYVIQAAVHAPDEGANSFFLNIDAEPQSPSMIWDLLATTAFEEQLVNWRGNGPRPKVFDLSAGTHQVVIRRRRRGHAPESDGYGVPVTAGQRLAGTGRPAGCINPWAGGL